jgi:hypothetical protein
MKKDYFIKTNVLLSIVAVCLLMTQAVAQFENYTGAVDPRGTRALTEKPTQDFSYKYLPPSGREGGEDIGSAIPIPALPFTDIGFTCDNINDYDEVCPYNAPGSPDVVYSYISPVNGAISVSLCNDATDYDTKLYIYENSYTPGSPIACNDDACSTASYPDAYVSQVQGVPVTAGNTYYIVIDGYGGDCGTYEILVQEVVVVLCNDCLTCSTPEGEGDIPNGGTDNFNGGCNSIPTVFSPIQFNQVICGRANTYINAGGGNSRDTDWYKITLAQAGTLYWSAVADFPLNLYMLSGDCLNNVYASGQSLDCTPAVLSAALPAGTYYLFAAYYNWDGLAVGRNYNAVATFNAPPPDDWCTLQPPLETPVSNWALFMAIGLIGLFVTFRIWRRA